MRDFHQNSSDRYIEDLFAREDVGLQAIRARLVAHSCWGVNIGPNEGRILQMFLQVQGATTGVEIGTLYGYSSVWIARALPASGRLFSIEKDPECARLAQQGFHECGVAERITLVTSALRALMWSLPTQFFC